MKWVKYIFAVIIATVTKRRDISLGNFILNQAAYVNVTPWIS